MTPQTEQRREQREEKRQDQFDLGRLATPVLKTGLERHSFGVGPQTVKELFLERPGIFRGTTIPDGTNFPSKKNLFVSMLIEERMRAKAA